MMNWKKIFLSLFSHLAVCIVLIAVTAAITLVWPGALPYVSAWAICACLSVMSIWDANSFGFKIRICYSYLAVMALSVIIFLFGLLDWALHWDILIAHWRYIAVFESLPLGALFFFFLLLLLAEEEEPSIARGWPERNLAT
jgi:hypothetical protein